MSFLVTETRVLDTNRSSHEPTGGIIRTRMSIVDRLFVDFPAVLHWEVDVDWIAEDRSTVTCTADVSAESGELVASGEVVETVEGGMGELTIPLSLFRVTVTGTYVVRVYVDSLCMDTTSIVISDSPR